MCLQDLDLKKEVTGIWMFAQIWVPKMAFLSKGMKSVQMCGKEIKNIQTFPFNVPNMIEMSTGVIKWGQKIQKDMKWGQSRGKKK